MSERLIKPNSDDLVDIGEGHHRAGQLQEAEECYRQALEIDPGHPGALYLLANIAYDDGRLSYAKTLIHELLRDESNDAEAWHLLGMIALREGDFTRATEYFGNAVAIQPIFTLAYYGLGEALQRAGNIDGAIASFQRAVALNPTFIDAHRALGNLFQVQKKYAEAVKSYQQAISIDPAFKVGYEGIGAILLSQEKWTEAKEVYKKAIAENVSTALIHVGLGLACSRLGDENAAIESFEKAVAVDPLCFLAYFHLGNAFYRKKLYSKAINSYERATTLNPQDINLLKKLAYVLLYNMRDYAKAAEIYRQVLVLDPADPIARHHFAACSGEAIPARAENAYIEDTFDKFSKTFDDVLVGQTKYCGPQLIAQAMQRECGVAGKQFKILDAGCGTGLCGLEVVAYSSQLTGVDLSAGMLEKAKQRNLYDTLIREELTDYLFSQFKAFDVIVSGDTFIYFGALEELLLAARNAIRDDGYLFFTAETFLPEVVSGDVRGYFLGPHGRYSHSEVYLKKVLHENRFEVLSIESNFLRYENSRAVQAFVVSCRALSR